MELIATNLTMSSREIAELTGKHHKDVLHDIRNMFEQLEIGSAEFSATYVHPQNKQTYECFNLDKELTVTLVSGYDVIIRHKIVKRWQELETNTHKPKQLTNRELALMVIAEADRADKAESKVKLLTHQNKLYTSTELAKECGLKSANVLNTMLADKKIQYKVNRTWVLCARYSELGYVSVKQTELDNGTIIYDRKWTGIGRDFILSLNLNNHS